MREYLFRGKSEATKQWVYGSLVVYDKTDTYCIVHQLDKKLDNGIQPYAFEKVLKETVGQYVGLDANKQKIFEGDVVQYIYPHALKYKYIVENFSCSVYPFDDELEPEDMQVLGNIHDNPELLQEVFNS